MIKVGFVGAVSEEWMGGLNYFKNLLYAIKKLNNRELQVYVFVGKKTDVEIKRMFQKYATVVEDSLFDRKSLKWYFMKIETKIFKTNYFYEKIFKKNNIQILSHSFLINFKNIKTINWIPDFQHLHLPKMFSKNEIKQRDRTFTQVIKQSDVIILSSNDTFEDFKKFASGYEKKVKVLQFVSQPNYKYHKLNKDDEDKLIEKYKIQDSFYYMPNQFWKHKNHLLVMKAINLLKKENININLVCTGYLNDYRNKDYLENIKIFIDKNNLKENIKILGLVDYEDVFGLIKMSKAVINPSLFEGWSSTVEECKSVGKNMILSDLNVHKEQYPNATFFDRHNVESLKNVLKTYRNEKSNYDMNILKQRTEKFANTYVEICKKVIQTS